MVTSSARSIRHSPRPRWASATLRPRRAHAERAVAASRRNETPAFLARELVFLAEARRRLGASSGDVRPLVREALTVAEPLGARVVAVDVERYGLPT